MKKNIYLLIIVFISSTVLVGAEPLAKKSKSVDKTKEAQLVKVKPAKEKSTANNIVKPMKKKPRKSSEVQAQLELVRKKFEAEKLLIDNQFKSDLKMLKNRKKEAMAELKAEYRKKRALLRKK
ncbi:MAG: hypothetical protein HOM61_06240 [Candidatus Marinimicrobia bacterium]|jgi:hypothetical protein|nr:hypothetical protein [Candidatus Neomarinimicrobiota bacterium]MBT5955296.1 hypothetical protein [Candidatus Neomarinimicrobiota bacterium]MBT6870601.1 hypothetical protein [Candidatus Neomarinimicrobiota bacterium]|tara:strand:- start:756 stop:1124 length:369 start_codon:yes stop_codon:yes gene_type:complete